MNIIKKSLLIGFLITPLTLSCGAEIFGATCWNLVWSDEFNGTSINTANWGYDTGCNAFGNNEWENYTSSPTNSYVSGGNLVINAAQTGSGQCGYTSARLTTYNKVHFTYGRIEARIKAPYGQGIWPAFWMLGENINTSPWPACGEIDIMEMIGGGSGKDNVNYGTGHWLNGSATQSGSSTSVTWPAKLADDFHVYSIEWNATTITWYFDGTAYYTLDTTAASMSAFQGKDFYIIFNVAVGGTWPGNPDGTTVFPQQMLVDYVRWYQQVVCPATPTFTTTCTRTSTLTDTPTSTLTWTRTPSVSTTVSCTRTFTCTGTPILTVTNTKAYTTTFTPTFTNTGTNTPLNTNTPVSTKTETPTLTSTCTQAGTYTLTATPAFTNTWSPTITPTGSPSATEVWTASSSSTPSNTAVGTPVTSATPTSTGTNTAVYTPTDTPQNTATNTPVNTWTNTAVNTKTITATSTFTATPSNTAANTATFTGTNTLTGTCTATQAFTATNTKTPVNTPAPTNTAVSTPMPASTPDKFEIKDPVVYPNPYNKSAAVYFRFNATQACGSAVLKIYTTSFRMILEEVLGACDDGRDIKPVMAYRFSTLANGTYYYVITAKNYAGKSAVSKIQKLMIIR